MKSSDLPCCNQDCSQGKYCLLRLRKADPDSAWDVERTPLDKILDGIVKAAFSVGVGMALVAVCIYAGMAVGAR
jgi:hypothetical protein